MEVSREGLQHGGPGAPPHPHLETPMARLIGRIPGRQVLPGGARAQHPEDPVQDVAGIAPRPTAPIATQTRSWQERREDRPLGVGQVHAVEYDGHRNFVHSPRFGVYEIASSLN